MSYDVEKAMGKLRHSVGADRGLNPKQWGYRRRYVTGEPDQDLDWLVSVGLMFRSDAVMFGGGSVYYATDAGMRAAGVPQSQIDKHWGRK